MHLETNTIRPIIKNRRFVNSRLCAFLLILLPYFLSSQNIKHLSVDHGLPQSFVSGITNDDEGFIWISTRNGLARYDGHEFKVFQHQPGTPNSLSSNFISHIQKNNDNTLLLKHETGEIDLFNFNSQKATPLVTKSHIKKNNFNITVRGWAITSDSTFWHINKDQNKVVGINLSNNNVTDYSFNRETVHCLFLDKHTNLWVLSQESLSKLNKETRQLERFPIPYQLEFNETEDFRLSVPNLYERENGELMWIDNKSIYFYNPTQNTFRKKNLPERLRHNIKKTIIGANNKEYFIANGNICSYDDSAGVVVMSSTGMDSRDLLAFFIDKSGLIWLGTNGEGIYTIDFSTDFNAHTYQSDFADNLLKIFFNIDLYPFFGLDPLNNSILAPGYYLRSAQKGNQMWIAINRTVCTYNLENKTIEKLPQLPSLDPSIDFAPIVGITSIDQGTPLVMDRSGKLLFFNKEERLWEQFSSEISLKNTSGEGVDPVDLYRDPSSGILWITTYANGLIGIYPNEEKTVWIKREGNTGFPTDNLLGIVPDTNRNDILWIGSAQGLIRFDTKTYSSELFSVKQGLPDNMIYSLLPDEEGYLWLGTNKGLCCFNTVTYKSRTFTTKHGLSNMEFNRFHQMQLPDGKMVFGGTNSGVVFNPSQIKKEGHFNPNIAITDIKVNNVAFEDNHTGNVFNSNNINKLDLPYNKNTLTIAFTALQFNQPQDIQYRYRLQGLDKDWVDVGKKREVVFTKIPAGDYQFQVNATNTTGKWSRHIKTLEVIISPPFWNTWWAWLGYMLLISAGIAVFINYRINKRVIKNEIALKEREAARLREIDKIKTTFFSNITHELRTPLSLITGPAQMLRKKRSKEDRRKLTSVILKNADSLLNLTNQLLEITKLQAGMLKPKLMWGDVAVFIRKVISVFSEEATQKQVQIKFEESLNTVYLYSPNTLERIMSNLISNALKFCLPGGSIEICLKENDNGLSIEVADNGKGIPESDVPHVFDRFYKGDNNDNSSGMGIGLSLVHKLVELHKGIINVSSKTSSPSGTTFSVFLPFKKGASRDFEMLETAQENIIKEEQTETESKPTVLVVEDNVELATFMLYSLQSKYRVLQAQNGKEGIELALQHTPDLIVSDVLMDKMNGFELCKQLKDNINTNHIPTILLTAKADTESKLEGLSLGADDYITKPFNIEELMIRIDNRLELQKHQREFFQKNLKLLPPLEKDGSGKLLQNTFLEDIYQIIDNHLDNERFGAKELAASLHMSRSSLHRKIKALTNLTSTEVIKAHRLRKAVALLNKDYSIAEVAYKTGFGSPSYFTKNFRETYHITPSEYLKQTLEQ